MRKLGQEVAARLQAVEMKGRLLTLKVMKRHPEAPVEPPKFMGHGICEQFSKSAPLADPLSGGATSDGDTIGETAWTLLDSLKFDPQELRGIGVQVTKLEGKDGSVTETDEKLGSGQKRLNFQVTSAGKGTRSPDGHSPVQQKTKDAKDLQLVTSFEIPTAETLDHAILDELPPDIREEILSQLRDAAQGAEMSGKQGHAPESLIISTEDDPVPEILPSLNDGTTTPRPRSHAIGVSVSTTSKAPLTSAAHITRQLRPKSMTFISPSKTALFSKPREAFQPSREELEELGVDAEVFFLLPKDLQREQLAYERENARKSRNTEKNADRSTLALSTGKKKTSGFGFGPIRGQFMNSPSTGPRYGRGGVKLEAKFPEEVALNLATRGDKVDPQITLMGKGQSKEESSQGLVNLGDIQAHLKRWVVSSHRGQLEPTNTDIEGLRSWLLRSMKVEGIEKPTIVLKWWRELLRRHWGERSDKGLRAVNIDDEDRLREAWWHAFWESKAQVDAIVHELMGGKLSLK